MTGGEPIAVGESPRAGLMDTSAADSSLRSASFAFAENVAYGNDVLTFWGEGEDTWGRSAERGLSAALFYFPHVFGLRLRRLRHSPPQFPDGFRP